MVFCGKPSKGCSHCRLRRIKCDQANPACSQCLRAGKKCPGYRDQLLLSFRDESEEVVRKAQLSRLSSENKKRLPAKSKASSELESFSRAVTVPLSFRAMVSAVPKALNSPTSIASPVEPIHDEGINFFFTHYVTAITKGLSIDLLSSPLWPLLYINKSYFNAVSSVGFAGLSNVTKDPSHMFVARKKHAESLRDITAALQDTSRSNLTATFISVMLLAAFEVVNGAADSPNDRAWGIHLDGGVAILKMIGARTSGLLPKTRMQIQFVFSVHIKCLSRGETAPVSMEEWTEKCRNSMTPVDLQAANLSSIVHRMVNLQAEIQNSNVINDSAAIFRSALALDNELDEWNAQLPDIWRFTVKKVSAEADFIYGGKVVYGGQMHVYQDLWTSRVYNHYRWARLLLNELILVHMSQLGLQTLVTTTQEIQSLEIITQLATEICTSVSTQFDRYTLEQACSNQVPPMSGCFLLLFPLAVAGSGIGVSENIHLWTIQMLEVFGNEMGISQALAMIPRMKEQRQRWECGYSSGKEYRVVSDLDRLSNPVVSSRVPA